MRDMPAIQERMNAEGVHFSAKLRSPEAKEAFAAFCRNSARRLFAGGLRRRWGERRPSRSRELSRRARRGA